MGMPKPDIGRLVSLQQLFLDVTKIHFKYLFFPGNILFVMQKK